MVPALFWSAVFAALAGAGPLAGVPDASQALPALVCTLGAALVGLGAVRRLRQ